MRTNRIIQTLTVIAVLGSATPSLETLHRARAGKLRTLLLPERVDSRPLPALTLVKRAASDKLLTPELASQTLDPTAPELRSRTWRAHNAAKVNTAATTTEAKGTDPPC